MRSRGWKVLAGVLALAGASPVLAAEYCVSADADDGNRTHDSIAAAIDAAAMTAEADRIRIVAGAADAGQALVIAGHDVTLSGGFDKCAQTEAGDSNTVVSGVGTAIGTPVITIFGPAEVRLEHLDITAGTGLDGGGINFVGAREPRAKGRLALAHTRVFDNVAGRDGGAIRIASQGNTANNRIDVVLEEGTHIDGNRALENGGGLHLTGFVELLAAAAELSFHDNEAVQGAGGAIYLQQPANANIGSAPWNGEATFLRNRAGGSGGAIHLEAPNDAPTVSRLRLYSVVADQPLVFDRNQAGKDGGALRVFGIDGPRHNPAPGVVCTSNVNFIGNQAGDGAALGLSYASYNRCGTPLPPRGVAQPCEPRQACNRIEDNRNLFANARGLVLLEATFASLYHSTIVHNQSSGAIFHLEGQDDVSGVLLMTTLVADNHLAGAAPALIRSNTGFNYVDVTDSTLAGNSFDASPDGVTAFDLGPGIDELLLTNSIVHQPQAVLLRAGATPNFITRNLLLHELPQALPPSDSIIVGDPRFAGPGDYRLQNDSPAVDFAPVSVPAAFDLDGNPRGIDLPERQDVFGPSDLGAFETPLPPPPIAVFADGFEAL